MWAKSGYTDLKHLSERIAKHERCTSHMQNAISLQLFGRTNIMEKLDSAYEREIKRHNEEVDKNRYVLNKIITVLKLCGSCELGIRGHDESVESLKPGTFRSIFDVLCEGDAILKGYYEQLPVFKGTSKTIQNELLECMYSVYRDLIRSDVQKTDFVSIEADETTDVSCKSQMVSVLRYLLENDTVVERFVEFTEVKDKTAAGLFTAINSILEECGVGEHKLIAQTYDGAAVMAGRLNGVQALVKEKFPYAHFVHCYAHQLNLIMQQLCATTHKEMKIFFAHLSAFASFFSTSPKRTAVLDEVVQRRLPRPSATRWNFRSRTVGVVYENIDELKECMVKFQEDPGWDTQTINESYGLHKLLNDDKFVTFLSFFARIMPAVDILYSKLQKRDIDTVMVKSAVTSFKTTVSSIRDSVEDIRPQEDMAHTPAKRRKSTASELHRLMKEACDTIICHTEDRFSRADHLIAAKLLNSEYFAKYATDFPREEFDTAVQYYPMLDKNKLKSELTILYSPMHKELKDGVNSAISLLKSLSVHNVKEIFCETVKLLNIIITTPMTTSESERCFSTLKRIKTSVRNTMSGDRLNTLAMLSIENQLVKSTPNFNTQVIVKFSGLKNQKANFHYKTLKDVGQQSTSQ